MDSPQKPPPPKLSEVERERLIEMGGPIDRVCVSLRFFGDALLPAELTKLLGCEPSKAHQKGDVLPDKRYHRVASTGSWLLNGTKPESADIEEQITALLLLVTQDLEVWRHLTSEFKADVFCGVFLEDCNRGFSLTPDITAKLSQRGLEIGFDIYSP